MAPLKKETVLLCNIKLEVSLVIVSCTAFFQISVCCNSPVTISALHVSYQYKNGKCEHLSAMNINSEPYQHQITVRGLPRGYENIREIFRKEKRFQLKKIFVLCEMRCYSQNLSHRESITLYYNIKSAALQISSFNKGHNIDIRCWISPYLIQSKVHSQLNYLVDSLKQAHFIAAQNTN